MLIQKSNPVGIDVNLQKLQAHIYNRILAAVQARIPGFSADGIVSYPRCYRNRTSDGYIAENYQGSNEYKEVYHDDTKAMVSFFGISPRVEHDVKEHTDAHLVVFANLATLYPAITHRADEELHRELIRIIGPGYYGFEYTGIETGIENILREYPGSRRDERLQAVDMHPAHAFRINFSVRFNHC